MTQPQRQHGPLAPALDLTPETEFKYLLVYGGRQGHLHPYRFQTYLGRVATSVSLSWPEWLPWGPASEFYQPGMAAIMTKWPAGDGITKRARPGERIAACFVDDDLLRKLLIRRHGWADVTEHVRRAQAVERERLAQPEPESATLLDGLRGVAAPVVNAVRGRRGGRRGAGFEDVQPPEPKE